MARRIVTKSPPKEPAKSKVLPLERIAPYLSQRLECDIERPPQHTPGPGGTHILPFFEKDFSALNGPARPRERGGQRRSNLMICDAQGAVETGFREEPLGRIHREPFYGTLRNGHQGESRAFRTPFPRACAIVTCTRISEFLS
jgi:hypothetical protein